MKKANMIIIGLILLILIFLLGCKNCKKHEGFSEDGRTSSVDGIPTAFGTVTGLTSPLTSPLTTLTSPLTSNVLAESANASYCAFIDTGSTNALKIAKKDTTTPPSWKVIWSSELSNFTWKGSTVNFAEATSSGPAKIKIGDITIGSGGTSTNHPTSIGTSAKLTAEGDLVIVKTPSSSSSTNDIILWSLVSHELKSSKELLNEYLNRGSRTYQSIELQTLKNKLTNFSKYINAVALTDGTQAQADTLKKAHAMIVQARHQMDFDLSELNGVANSKVVSSQNGLNSSLYVNLMATTLVAGLFILIATRGNLGFP